MALYLSFHQMVTCHPEKPGILKENRSSTVKTGGAIISPVLEYSNPLQLMHVY